MTVNYIRYSKEEFKKLNYTLVHKEKILGLNFHYYSSPLKTLRVFFVDKDEFYTELIWFSERAWRNQKLFEIYLKQTLTVFMKRPEIQEKIKYLLTNGKNYDII